MSTRHGSGPYPRRGFSSGRAAIVLQTDAEYMAAADQMPDHQKNPCHAGAIHERFKHHGESTPSELQYNDRKSKTCPPSVRGRVRGRV
jgi:hypothetical protein